jgi:hypothetical protein
MRTLTIVINFDQDHKPEWIWESHMNQSLQNGFLISIIAEGDRVSNEFEK